MLIDQNTSKFVVKSLKPGGEFFLVDLLGLITDIGLEFAIVQVRYNQLRDHLCMRNIRCGSDFFGKPGISCQYASCVTPVDLDP